MQPTGEAYRVVTPDYFATVGIPTEARAVARARAIARKRRRIVVNEALVKKYYPGENPLGKPVYLGAPDNRLFDQRADRRSRRRHARRRAWEATRFRPSTSRSP